MIPRQNIVWIISNLIHYHAARFRAVQALVGARAHLVELSNIDADFSALEAAHDLGNIHTCVKGRSWRTLSRSKLNHALHGMLDELAPKVVVVNGWAHPGALSAIMWARRHCANVVVTSESQTIDFDRVRLKEEIKRRVVGLCDAALVGGRTHADYIISLGMAPSNVFVGYNAVDNTHFSSGARVARCAPVEQRAKMGLPARYLVASARFTPKKNLGRMIAAFALACENTIAAPDLVLIGDGPERDTIRNVIDGLARPEKVHLLGFRRYEELPLIYGLADGFVHASSSEQWGLVVNEAAAAGLPLVVSRNCGAASELVRERRNGFIVDPYNTADIALGIRKLIDLSAAERQAMGRESLTIVEEWSPARFAEGFVSACSVASAATARSLSLWDRTLLNALIHGCSLR